MQAAESKYFFALVNYAEFKSKLLLMRLKSVKTEEIFSFPKIFQKNLVTLSKIQNKNLFFLQKLERQSIGFSMLVSVQIQCLWIPHSNILIQIFQASAYILSV
jgi:hypothetical protein